LRADRCSFDPERRKRPKNWDIRAGRHEVAEYLAWRRAKIDELPGGENQFKVEYPENDVDCFEQTGRPVIQARYLKVTCRPQEPMDGHEYIIGCDTSLGFESGDPAAIEVLDITTGRQVTAKR
jgi:hypothetical protein